MKSSKRNFFILLALPAVIFYVTSLVVGFTEVPVRESAPQGQERGYLRSLKMQLLKAVQEKRFAEAEMFFRRIKKLDKNTSSMVQRLGSCALFYNGKLNEAETLLRNLLLRNPGDFICRNNYAVVLMVKNRPRAVEEFFRASEDSGGISGIEKNLRRSAEKFKVELPRSAVGSEDRNAVFSGTPADLIVFGEEKK
ncbi:MAG: hypothetical protein E7048_08460 [Lentisphaerae bacterium]|nr:hypothetical protein [Lentisphaerota bacterium]